MSADAGGWRHPPRASPAAISRNCPESQAARRRRRAPGARRGGSTAPSPRGRSLGDEFPARTHARGVPRPSARCPPAPWRCRPEGARVGAAVAVVPGPWPRGPCRRSCSFLHALCSSSSSSSSFLFLLPTPNPIDVAFRVAWERAPGGPAPSGASLSWGSPRRCVRFSARVGLLSHSLPVAGEVLASLPRCAGEGRLYRPGLCDGRVAPRAPQVSLDLKPQEKPCGEGCRPRSPGKDNKSAPWVPAASSARAAVRLERVSRDTDRERWERETRGSQREGNVTSPRWGCGRGRRARSARVPLGALLSCRRLLQSEPPRPGGLGCPGRARLVGSLSPLARPVLSARPGVGGKCRRGVRSPSAPTSRRRPVAHPRPVGGAGAGFRGRVSPSRSLPVPRAVPRDFRGREKALFSSPPPPPPPPGVSRGAGPARERRERDAQRERKKQPREPREKGRQKNPKSGGGKERESERSEA